MSFESDFANPPREFTLMPFWFWNDVLDADEIRRQIADFDAHGVFGFVIHPRVGLPRDCGWMSDNLLDFYAVAIEEAAKRDMRVLLYDEGMYPSGSSSGQLVEKHPDLACRCLALHDEGDALPADATVVQSFTAADGTRKNIVDRRAKSVIRGLHYQGEGPAEDEPPAGDILNERTAPAIAELVHEKFYQRFGPHFGRTILGVFTDEPNPLGRLKEKKVFAYTPGLLPHVDRLLGYDFAPHLPMLWTEGEAGDRYRKAWRHAVRLRLEETWYKPLSDWCAAHGVALCGHPDAGDEIGVQRHFQIPGQDLVWRWVLPDHPSALEGPESTQGKCSASAMVHHGRRRNSNEFAGAYGHEATFDEVRWLANWCFVRGVNLLIPHAFYYSVRGPRIDERPPQLGPHTPQWDNGEFKTFADHCRRMSWLNTDCTPLIDIAVLTHDDRCPWPAAKTLLTHQRDFHYLDPATLIDRATIDGDALVVGDMAYRVVVIDGTAALPPAVEARLRPLIAAGAVLRFTDEPARNSTIPKALQTPASEVPRRPGSSPAPSIPSGPSAYLRPGVRDTTTNPHVDDIPQVNTPADLVAAIDAIVPPRGVISPASADVRLRRVHKSGHDVLLAFNESGVTAYTGTLARRENPESGGNSPSDSSTPAPAPNIFLPPAELALIDTES